MKWVLIQVQPYCRRAAVPISRQIERLERDTGIGTETLALFVQFWLSATPQLPETHQEPAQAKGRERYERFVEALGRRLAKGKTLTKEVSENLPTTAE